MEIRDERPEDVPRISRLVTEAFRDAPHTDGTEALIVERLRAAGALALSLVAVEGPTVLGHVAFSPVTISGAPISGVPGDWYGLGPLAVRASERRRGVGEALVRAGLARLGQDGAAGCVVLGDPAYYHRFGFRADPALTLDGVPPAYFQVLRLRGNDAGSVAYHPGFYPSGGDD